MSTNNLVPSIEKLEIKNFRGIRKCVVEGLSQVNLFIGPNNSGKSTILESIWLISRLLTDQPHLGLRSLLERRAKRDVWNAKELWFEYDTVQDVEIRFNFKGIEEVGMKLQGNFEFNNFTVLSFKGDEIREYIASMSADLSNFANKSVLLIPFDVSEMLKRAVFFDRLSLESPRSLEESCFKEGDAKQNAVCSQLSKIYNEDINTIDNILYTTNFYKLSISIKERKVFLDNVGDGMRQSAYLLSLMASMKPTVFLIEEIEMHQHPLALRNLVDQIIKLAKEKHHQVFLTTHSPDVFGLFTKYDKEGASVFKLYRGEDGIVYVKKIESESLKDISDLGLDVGGLIKYRTFVVVEGDTDSMILKSAAKKLNKSFEDRAIDVIPAGGKKKNLSTVAKALLKNESKIIVVPDIDDKQQEDAIQSFWESIKSDNSFTASNDKLIPKSSTSEKYTFSKKNIIPAGLPEKFRNLKSHSMDDYFLELIIENKEKLEKEIPESIYQKECKKAKYKIEELLGEYNKEVIKEVIEKAEKIPDELSSLIDKIINLSES